jgi:hypothetical protein
MVGGLGFAQEQAAPAAETVEAPPPPPEATVARRMRNGTTIHSIGIEWDIRGDTNHNATCAVQYRKMGEEAWKAAMPLVRIDADTQSKYANSDRAYNMLAGSIFFLDPGTTYEVELDLADPDGGSTTETVELTTWEMPHFPKGGKTWHVAPGNGGGAGTADDPFRGIPLAHIAAQPGDIVRLHAGNYGDVNIDKVGEPGKPIVWTAAGDGEVVFHRLTVKSYHWIDGIAFRRDISPEALASGASYKYALNAAWDETSGVYVTRCVFRDYVYSILLAPDGADWYIADNDIIGHKDGPGEQYDESWKTGEGVELHHSSNCVVAYNRIQKVADGISYPTRNCDIYGNDIFDTSDDGIEADYGYANVRMWNNRIYDMANYTLSFQPQFCGPWYFFRNQVDGPFKHFIVQQWFCIHNTMPLNVIPRPRYEHADKVVYINNRRLPEEAFENGASAGYIPLPEGSPQIDAGEVLVNINDPFVKDGKPDLGAYEFGQPLPQIGPRSPEFLKMLYEGE